MSIPATVRPSGDESPVVVGWMPSQGFCVDLGDGDLVVANNPLDAPRISAALSAMSDLYKRAAQLRDDHAELLEESSDEAESFLSEITKTRKPKEEPPEWPP